MTEVEVVHPKLFTRRESERTHLHPEYICDVLFSPAIDEPLMAKEKRMYSKVSALGRPLVPTEGSYSRQDLQRSQDVAGPSENVPNIWEQESTDEDEEQEVGNDDGTHEGDSRLYEAPSGSVADADDLGSDMDRFVENEFQFLESDDDNEDEGRRLASKVPLHSTLSNQPAEMKDQLLLSPSLTLPRTNTSTSESDEVTLPNPEAPIVTSRSSIPQESLDFDEVLMPDLEAPDVPAPPPLPPEGVLFALNSRSATEPIGADDGSKTLHRPETKNEPETMHIARNVPKNIRPKNEPQSSQNELFLELQGILNRRLKKINDDIEGSHILAAAAAAAPMKPTSEPLNHRAMSEERLVQRAVVDEKCLPNSFHPGANRTEGTEVAEDINRANPFSSRTCTEEPTLDRPVQTIEGSSADLIQVSASVEPPDIDSNGGVLPIVSDGAETLLREESRGSDKELDSHSVDDISSHATSAPSQVQVLESQSLVKNRANQVEVEEKVEVPGDETILTFNVDAGRENQQLQEPETDAIHQNSKTSPAAVPDAVTSSNQLSSSVHENQHFFSSHNHLEANPVVNKASRVSRSSSTAVYDWATPSGDDWTPEMDLQDDEFDDDLHQEIPTRGIHHKRREAAGQQRLHKKTPSKLYQKKPLRDQLKPANPGAFSLARINRAVKRVFGSISNRQSKHRPPLSDGVFLQDDGWEIYPARPYDQLTSGETVKVVGAEMRPAYAYNAITRQLVILPDHDRILVTDDGRMIRDQKHQPSVRTGPSPPPTDSFSSSSETGKGDKSRIPSKSKASRQHPPNLNTKTVKSIHMHRRSESTGEDSQTTADDAYWRRNSSPNSADRADSVPSVNLTKRKTSTLSQILSFRKSAAKSAANGKKSNDLRMTASDMDLVRNGAVRHGNLRQV